MYRGNAKFHQVRQGALEAGDPAAACTKKKTLEEGIRDVEQALLLNQRAANTLETNRKLRDPRDLFGIAADKASLKTLEDRSITANKILTAALSHLRTCE